MGIQWTYAELGDDIQSNVLSGTDLFVHLAHDMSPKSEVKNINGTIRWFCQAREHGVPRQLFLTSYSAHPNAPSGYGRAKHSLERFFIENNQYVLRLGLVIGQGGLFARMVEAIRSFPIVPVFGGHKVKVAITDIDVVCNSICNVNELRRGVIYGLFQKERIPLASLITAIRSGIGTHNLIIPIPVAMSKVLLNLSQMVQGPDAIQKNSFLALLKSQDYPFKSSYSDLGLKENSIKEIIGRIL
jgi:nucleoside-diphosphate-sugar epimerase